MTEKDINIENEENLNEAPVEDTEKETAEATENQEAAADEAAKEEEEVDPLTKAQQEIEEKLYTHCLGFPLQLSALYYTSPLVSQR